MSPYRNTSALLTSLAFVANACSARAGAYTFVNIDPTSPAANVATQQWAAFGFNDQGQVLVEGAQPGVDYSYTDASYIYNTNTSTYTPVGVAPAGAVASSTQAIGINNSGEIVGLYYPGGSNYTGQWQGYSAQSGVVTTIDPFGASFSAPQGLNNSGVVVGYYGTPDASTGAIQYHGFTDTNGAFTSVDATGSPSESTALTGVNDSGVMIGVYGDIASGELNKSFILQNGVSHEIALPDLNTTDGFYAATDVFAINDSGEIVGGASNDGFHTGPAFTYKNGVFTIFSYPGALETFANGIDSKGDISGQYIAADGTVNAFLALLSPAPEPAAWALMLTGLGFVGQALRSGARRNVKAASA